MPNVVYVYGVCTGSNGFVHVTGQIIMHVFTFVWRLEVDMRCLPQLLSNLFFETWPLSKPEAY